MQSLYAYEQAKKANFLLAEEMIEEHFAPDLNSMEVQDRTKLKGLAKLGIHLLHEEFAVKPSEEDFSAPAEVKDAVRSAKQYCTTKNRADFEQIGLRSLKEADKVFEIYFKLLNLYLVLADLSKSDKNHEGKSRLSDLKLLQELEADKDFEVQALRMDCSWEDEKDFVRELYNKAFVGNARYTEYCEKVNHTVEEEVALIKYIVKNVFLKHEVATSFFEQYHIYWTEDKDTLRAMVSHTFQNYQEDGALSIAKANDEWLERREFLRTLFKETVNRQDEYVQWVLPKLKNWEYERIADMDKILLYMALVEFQEFSSIPVKVTINEIIEIAKMYSTPKSGVFLNGVLDKLSKEMLADGRIRKSGRGMLDNK